jgi:microcystin-dependent protein
MKNKLYLFVTLLALATLSPQLSTAFAQGTTAFTYQGQLTTGTNAANGSYDMTFAIYDANVAGNLIAGPITNSALAVSNGLFTATLNFGAGVFTGTNYWVQLAVSPANAGTFVTLVPRQQLTPAPYAISLVAPQAYGLCPPGSVMAYMGTSAPTGWLLCNGTAYSRTQYAALFAVVGTGSGQGDGSTTFNVPNMQGVFLRGVDNGIGNDPDTASRIAPPLTAGGNSGDAVGSFQADLYKSHNHGGSTVPSNPGSMNFTAPAVQQVTAGQSMAVNSTVGLDGVQFTGNGTTLAQQLLIPSDGGSETRPKNVYVNYIIKY